MAGLSCLNKPFARENGYDIAKSVAPFLVDVCCLPHKIQSHIYISLCT